MTECCRTIKYCKTIENVYRQTELIFTRKLIIARQSNVIR